MKLLVSLKWYGLQYPVKRIKSPGRRARQDNIRGGARDDAKGDGRVNEVRCESPFPLPVLTSLEALTRTYHEHDDASTEADR